ncbi:MAG TPA: ASKHA domain-containing protein [Thermoclostridium sp.]|nr:ASKHA domain-containing protein [Thermoclostridium sp.]
MSNVLLCKIYSITKCPIEKSDNLPEIIVHTENSNISFHVPDGITLLEALKNQGFNMETPCNGKGVCGKCRVLIHNLIPYTAEERMHLSESEIDKGIHLSCMVNVIDDMEISLNINKQNASIITHANVSETEGRPVVKKRFVSMPQPSIEDQRSDEQRLMDSIRRIESKSLSAFNHLSLSFLKKLPIALRNKEFNVTLVDTLGRITGVESGNTVLKNYGVAVDIGTTTLAAYLYDMNTGKNAAISSLLNPQKKHGADVISRIEYASKSKDNLLEMSQIIQNALNDLINELTISAGIKNADIYAVTLSGNTTMLHLLLGIPSENIASAPFVPVTLSALILGSEELQLDINPSGNLFVLPSVSAYVGSDTTSAVLSTGLHKRDGISLLVDIGTNGEIVIGNNSFLYACSTAAGPAFEGANIACGMGGIEGAISSVCVMDDGNFEIKTIGEKHPIGICGSGLVDAVSCMLEIEILDETGRIVDSDEMSDTAKKYGDRIISINNQPAFLLVAASDTGHGEQIYISQKDIRELQNAKAAIAAGISVLIKATKSEVTDIKNVYLSGGFGNFISIESALNIGLLPKELSDRVTPVGNAAGAGAIYALMSEEKLSQACDIARKIQYIELSSNVDFTNEYTENMFFNTANM